MNLSDLNLFVTAARLESVTAAAKELSTVQSNVTARIRLLEAEFGVALFHRHPRGIRLTAKGEELLSYATQMLVLMAKAKDRLAGRENDPYGLLRIGALHSTAASRLPGLLKDYAVKHRRVEMMVETGIASELTDRVLSGRLEGAFVSGYAERPELEGVLAFVEDAVVLTSPAHRTLRGYLRAGGMPKVLVFRAGCSYRQKLEHYLFSEGHRRWEEMEFGTFDGIIGCVGAGLGITLLPRSVVERSILRHEVRMHALPAGMRRVETWFVTRRDRILSSAMERWIELLLDGGERTGKGPGKPAGARKSG